MVENPQITLEDLKAKLRPLAGTMIGRLIGGVNLQTDTEGNVPPHVLRNLKMTIGTVMRMSPDSTVKGACEKTLGELDVLLGEKTA